MFIPHSKPTLSEKDRQALLQGLDTGMLASGSQKKKFEKETAAYLGYDYALATSTGSAALELILRSLHVQAGDEVILPTYVCHSVYDAVVAAGATPVLCDVSAQWVMGPETIKPYVTARTKAVILVYTFGINANNAVWQQGNYTLIHDLCQAFAKVPGLKGPAFCSFHATKCLTTGEGGMALFDTEEHYKQAESVVRTSAYRYKLSDLQAYLGLSQLAQYGSFLKARKQLAETYLAELKPEFTTKTKHLRDNTMWFRFPIEVKTDKLDQLIAEIEQTYQVAVRKGVDELLHRRYHVRDDAAFPVAAGLIASTLSLPLYPSLDEAAQRHIIDIINRIGSDA